MCVLPNPPPSPALAVFMNNPHRYKWSISRLDAIQSNKPAPDSDPVYLAVMLRSGLHPASALSEAKEMLGPGTDTAASSLAHALYALAHDVNFQDRLVQDCAKAGFPLDLNALEEIPTLRASVKEAIRWTASATAVLPRVVPPEGVVLAGVFVPGGVSRSLISLGQQRTWVLFANGWN